MINFIRKFFSWRKATTQDLPVFERLPIKFIRDHLPMMKVYVTITTVSYGYILTNKVWKTYDIFEVLVTHGPKGSQYTGNGLTKSDMEDAIVMAIHDLIGKMTNSEAYRLWMKYLAEQ